jgi:hypothetical protein
VNETIDKVIAALTELREHNVNLEAIKDQHSAAQADLEATQKELEAKNAELASATAGLSAAQIKAQKEHDVAIYDKQIELRDLGEKTKAAKAELDEVLARVNSASAQHDAIEASLASIREKHFA